MKRLSRAETIVMAFFVVAIAVIVGAMMIRSNHEEQSLKEIRDSVTTVPFWEMKTP